MTARPTQLERTEDRHLVICWSDGQQRRYSFRELRDACPCATCREKRAEPKDPLCSNALSATEAQPLGIQGMRPVGNYAYSIDFSDGHDTGIFTFELLQKLGQPMEG